LTSIDMFIFVDLMNFQYFIEVVPTEVMGWTGKKVTYQYSVKEHTRPIDHSSGSHGTPGIYFKYDISALKVEVTKDREGFFSFLVRLCAGVGGLVATSTIVCGLLKNFVEYICCMRSPESPKKSSLNTPITPSFSQPSILSQSEPMISKHKLISSSQSSPFNSELTKSS